MPPVALEGVGIRRPQRPEMGADVALVQMIFQGHHATPNPELTSIPARVSSASLLPSVVPTQSLFLPAGSGFLLVPQGFFAASRQGRVFASLQSPMRFPRKNSPHDIRRRIAVSRRECPRSPSTYDSV